MIILQIALLMLIGIFLMHNNSKNDAFFKIGVVMIVLAWITPIILLLR